MDNQLNIKYQDIVKSNKLLESSFRDPSGFLYWKGDTLLRQINHSYKEDYELLMNSGLYQKLIQKNLLIEHQELQGESGYTKNNYKIIRPEKVDFISYPYEWSFHQLKDAALTTLNIQKLALEHKMTLKDASAYNIQFYKGKPVFIDTLSFEAYKDGNPWVAYKQFCQHFLAPLALMSYTDLRLSQLLKIYIDGVPLDLASKLLPLKTKFNFSLLMHLHLHAKAQKKYENKGSASKGTKIKSSNLKAVILSLTNTIKSLKIKNQQTEWGDYYNFTNYSDKAFSHKKKIISTFVDDLNPKTIWDIGANTGEFTAIASKKGVNCIAFDIDPLAVDANYLRIKKQKIDTILPLVLDLTNPTPSIGWANEERPGFKNRPKPDGIFALALIHHIAISNNVPFIKIAKFFSELSDNLIIEFVSKSDSKVKILLESREDIFPRYHEKGFVEDFKQYYDIHRREEVKESDRVLFWMKKK